ncbi:unnamed protein product [Haemonchus placei]|uniref:Bromo domain-containing protein n=1 Tax=Haemonchus placei TaxID=6290 RepID=A0A158QPY1_HAEPC|nr:unnamed protein product [Haemonchus placei]
MSAKRKRLEDTAENSPPEGTPTPKRRKGRISAKERERISEENRKAQGVYNVLRQHTDSENRQLAEKFIRTPSRRAEPDYYKQVKSPIDFTRIQQKLKTEEYQTFEEFCEDVELLVDNTRTYYKVWSISPAPSSRASSNGSSDEVETEMVEDILCALLELTDSTGRLISPPFRVLQSKEEFPVYYEKIRHPMDLKTIAEKARAGLYKRMSQVEADVRLQIFSGKGSEIYKDAVALMTFFKEKRDLVLEKGVHPKRRDKVRRAVDGLLIQAALPPVAELSEDSEEDEDTEESDDPLWKLYWTVRNLNGNCQFNSLFSAIILIILMKYLVFENACEYNMESSDIFIAAQKLQNLTIRKARELQPSLDLSASSNFIFIPTIQSLASTPPPEKKRYRSPKKMRPISTGMTAEHVSLPGRPGRKSMDELMLRYRQKLMTFWDLIYNHKIGIYWPAGAFMELPSSREYPDYYQVIEHPIDMKIIRDKIENNRYESSVQLIEEFTILFNNARQYNEANSQIARDAAVLLSMVTTAHATDKDAPYESPMALKQKLPAHEQQMWKLYTLVRDATDADGRKLAGAFIKLPTKEEYPDYYEVIRKPMDLQRIQHRLQAHGYGRWIDLVADLSLMLENACKYNEPESTIYKDAVALQRLVLEKKRELGAAEDCMPRVQMEIRTMFTNIFSILFLFFLDSEGRCRCDSFAELPDLLKARGFPRDEWPFSLDQIKRNIDKVLLPCEYSIFSRLHDFPLIRRRFDGQGIFDFFDLFERARELSRSDSKLFEDATELQLAFIRERDAQCKGVLVSTAFIAIENVMTSHDSIILRELFLQEGEVDLDSLNFDGVEYITPSYAYITRTDDNSRAPPHIMRIERIFKTDTGEMMVRGKWVYRPHETLHLANRKFIENEVFITPFIDTVLAERLCGKCMVVPVKVAMHNVVEGINPTDLFVCECRYLGKPRYFAKLKSWPFPGEEDSLKLTSRSRPLSPVRVTSNFMNVDGVIPARAEADADGRTYLHAMRTHSGKYHDVGQFVLVFNPQKPTCDVMRVDKLWREKDGSEWFSGGWLARPSEIQHDCGRTFYVREVFAVDQPDQTRRIEDIQSHCAVLTPKEFVKERPTEIPECDVFVCESRVPGVSFAKGEPSSLFTKPSEKVCNSILISSVFLSTFSGLMSNWLAAQPKLTAKSKSGYILFSAEIRKRIMHENPDSGFGEVSKIVGIEWKKLSDDQKRQYEVRAEYIASERAKQEAARAATEKTLQPGQIRIYQCKWINCDSQFDSENGLYEHIVQHHTSQIIMDSEQQYVCMWVTCVRNRKDGKPFPSLPRLHRHMKEKHLATAMKSVYANQIGKNFFKLSTQSTPNGETVFDHPVSDGSLQFNSNILATNAATTSTSYCSNAFASRSSSYAFMLTRTHGNSLHNICLGSPLTVLCTFQPSSSMAVPTITDAGRTVVKSQGVDPVFVAPPSSVHARRVLHSETYLRYIESLSSNRQRTVSKWDTSLSTNPRNAQPNAARPPPTHWIRESRGRPIAREEDVVRALWRLRDELLESTCNMSVERDVGGIL